MLNDSYYWDTKNCIQLWSAVMLQAFNDVYAPQDYGGATQRELIKDRAKAWFVSNETGIGTFLWCCSVLEFDPENVRAYVAKPHVFDQHDLAVALVSFRRENELTQEQMGKLCGIHPTTISHIETHVYEEESLRERTRGILWSFLTENGHGKFNQLDDINRLDSNYQQ